MSFGADGDPNSKSVYGPGVEDQQSSDALYTQMLNSSPPLANRAKQHFAFKKGATKPIDIPSRGNYRES